MSFWSWLKKPVDEAPTITVDAHKDIVAETEKQLQAERETVGRLVLANRALKDWNAHLCAERHKMSAELTAIKAERDGLNEENFSLAAGACINPGQHGLVGDERGNSICTAYAALIGEEEAHTQSLATINQLQAELAALRPDAQKWRDRKQADRDYRANKRKAVLA